MKPVLITPINSQDLDAVGALSIQLGYPNSSSNLEARFARLSALPNHALFKLTDQGQLKGWMHLERVFDLIEDEKVEIKAIVVDEASRGEGHGRKLIEHAKKWVRSEGLGTIYLSCNIVRERTHEFYKREGFSLVKTSHFFELNL